MSVVFILIFVLAVALIAVGIGSQGSAPALARREAEHPGRPCGSLTTARAGTCCRRAREEVVVEPEGWSTLPVR